MTGCVHKVRWSVKRPEDCRFRLSVSHYKDRIVAPDEYTGSTEVTPSDQTQVLETKDKLVREDITIEGITGTQVITENGEYDVVDKATVIVNNPAQWTSKGLAEGTEPSGEIYLNNIHFVRNAFSYNSAITKVKGENLYGAYSVFEYCSALTEWNLHFIELGYVNFFSQNCPLLKKVVLKIDRNNGSGNFLQGCPELEIADFTVPNIRGATFSKCYKIQTLIIRNTDRIVSLDNVSAFTDTPFRGYNDLSGVVYVPQALIENYKTANNWKTVFAEGHLTFLPLEESEWADKYADGTPVT